MKAVVRNKEARRSNHGLFLYNMELQCTFLYFPSLGYRRRFPTWRSTCCCNSILPCIGFPVLSPYDGEEMEHLGFVH